MASPYRQPHGNEQTATCSPVQLKKTAADMIETHASSNRPALANVSPNVVRAGTVPSGFMKPALMGSPLKRSFTLAMEEGEGMLYLKRRKLADHEVLSDLGQTEDLIAHEPIEEIENDVSPIATLESAIHAPLSPTEPNTPSERDETSQGSSAERKSFSSLINYDASSQTSHLLFNGPSNAEILRLRLCMAMFKVRTGQINVPFSDLKDQRQKREEQQRKAIEDAVAELRKEAQEVLSRTYPAVADAKTQHMRFAQTGNGSRTFDAGVPSSPPARWSPEKMLQARLGVGQINTPPRRIASLQARQAQETELTSSAVRGKVAEGLLGLRNAAYF